MAGITLVRVGIAACVLALGAGAALGHVLASRRSAPTIAEHPAPPLFAPSMYAPLASAVRAAEARADTAFRRWISANPGRHDTRFSRWAERAVGPAGGGAAELQVVRRLTAARTPEQGRATLWLESFGKKDLWYLFARQYGELYGPAQGRTVKRAVKRSYKLASSVAGAAKSLYRRPSPYEAAPSLRALNRKRFTGVVRFSYPSKHAVIASAESTVLGVAEPGRARELDGWKDQIDYSRLVGGGHYPTDVTAGAFLGRLVGDYEIYLERIGR